MMRVSHSLVGLALGGLVATSLTGCGSAQVVDTTNQRLSHGLSTAEVATARVVAMRWVAQEGAVASASVTVSKGKVAADDGRHHHACSSGRLLNITLRGVFPHGPSGGPDSKPVQGEALTVDAVTGTICGASSLTGPIVPDPYAFVLFSN
jgi:hypothetical protein